MNHLSAKVSPFRDMYQTALSFDPTRLHFAAHSHHLWPDVTKQAQLAYWEDSCKLADEKWSYIFSEIYPALQKKLSQHLHVDDPNQFVFASNTHEFVVRILSSLKPGKIPSILTTDSEFYSFDRQIRRYEEAGLVQVERVSVLPYADFPSSLFVALQKQHFDLIFMSQVFFNSGLSLPALDQLRDKVRSTDTLVVIDGYHAFGAIPVSLKGVQDRFFYLAGGYKYAQAGEGICFMNVPNYQRFRPVNTGWFADSGHLTDSKDQIIGYGKAGIQFAGATQDPSGAYRMLAVFEEWERRGITISSIHDYVQQVKSYFIEKLSASKSFLGLSKDMLILPEFGLNEGHFLTFRTPNAQKITASLGEKRIIVDCRGDRLRFGFGLYHDEEMIDRLFEKIKY